MKREIGRAGKSLSISSRLGLTPKKAEVSKGKSATRPQSKHSASKTPDKQERRHSLPGFSIISRIGGGGMSIVFLAEEIHRNLGPRKVALKILNPKKALIPTELEKFRNEAQMLIHFRHPNLVRALSYNQYRSLHFMVMEYLNGKTVQTMIAEKGHIEEEEALDIVLQVSEALDYIEKQGILHRDIKPANIVVLNDGTAKLCDLGYAQKLNRGAAQGFEERTNGTAQYMSPEQAMGKTDIDIRSDIYSLGATLYHMVMGELPFTGSDNMEIMAKQVLESLNSPNIKNKGLSRHMHYFIERMMSKEIDLRYATPRQLIDDIESHLRGLFSMNNHRGMK